MMIENNKKGFEALWRRLDEVVDELRCGWKRVSVRNVALRLLGEMASDEALWEVCNAIEMYGQDLLPLPEDKPRKCREMLLKVAEILLDIPRCEVNLKALDDAYRTVFPDSRPIDTRKKGR